MSLSHERLRNRARRAPYLIAAVAGAVALAGCGQTSAATAGAIGSASPTNAPAVSAAAATTSAEPRSSAAETLESSAEPAMSTAATLTDSEPTSAQDLSSASASSAGESPGTDATALTATPVPDPIANTVRITTPGMRYDISGPLRPGIAAITFVNTDDEAHMMAFTRLKPGVTLDQVKKALNTSEEAAVPLMADGPGTSYGTPSEVGAGMTTTVVAENLPAGNYALVCFLASKSGQEHWQMGMIDLLKVAGAKATEKPKAAGTITVDDKRITLPDGFAGHGTFLVSNTGKQPHNLSLARLDEGTTLPEFVGHVGQAMQSNTPIDGGGGVLAGGIDGLAPGQSAYLDLDLPTGHYGCISTEDIKGPDLPGQHGEFDVR